MQQLLALLQRTAEAVQGLRCACIPTRRTKMECAWGPIDGRESPHEQHTNREPLCFVDRVWLLSLCLEELQIPECQNPIPHSPFPHK